MVDVMEEEDSVEVMGVDVDMDVEDVEGKCRRFFFPGVERSVCNMSIEKNAAGIY